VRIRRIAVTRALIELCADLGGRILVHGLPSSGERRGPEPGRRPRPREGGFAAIVRDAEQTGATYCIEPLAPPEAELINRSRRRLRWSTRSAGRPCAP
jgi:D-psicose/D-tagatose/L-ribulose 3-epimerase